MHREFVPCEQAAQLKELGFDELCFSYYKNNQSSEVLEAVKNSEMRNVNNEVDDYISAPTFSQALKFFRENCGLYAQTPSTCVDDVERAYYISPIYDELDNIAFESEDLFNTYEEAELSTLKSLIELVKNK
jgi:hypothetical protein